jgi:hypothetical protein
MVAGAFTRQGNEYDQERASMRRIALRAARGNMVQMLRN